MQGNEKSIIDYLTKNAEVFPEKAAFILLDNEEMVQNTISYKDLEARAKEISLQLRIQNFSTERILLFIQDPIQFIISFLACQYAGAIPVPVPYAKSDAHFLKLEGIVEDAQVKAIICSSLSLPAVQRGLRAYITHNQTTIMEMDSIPVDSLSSYVFQPLYHNISFLQYTSGSTSNPKGVVVSNQNLLSNQEMIKNVFGCRHDSIILSWLPFYHDMGLIGSILHSLYIGCTCILMLPLRFVQKPQSWLKAISKYKVTHTGGPNFAYDYCVDRVAIESISNLNLSTWEVAYNGSEPVRWETLQNFTQHFKAIGFRENAFYPCYGLAEGTLLIAGVKNQGMPALKIFNNDVQSIGLGTWNESLEDGRFPLVSCGRIAPEVEVKILSTDTGIQCEDGKMGEIHISGPNVTEGYWNKNLNSAFVHVDSKSYLKTGDIGCFYAEELFVAGRQKEMLIIRGQNYFPYDLELIASSSHSAVEPNGVAVFNRSDSQEIIVVAEIKRSCLKLLRSDDIINRIDQAIIAHFGLSPFDILLTTPSGLPRTTSGKIQRVKCWQLYKSQTFEVIESKRNVAKGKSNAEVESYLLQKVLERPVAQNIKAYVLCRIESRVGFSNLAAIDEGTKLTDLGLDSLRSIELINELNRDFAISLDAPKVMGSNSFTSLIEWIENILWLKNEPASGEEIVI